MQATVQIDPARIVGTIDPRIYGQFLSRRRWVADESLHNPDHPRADGTGLRQDVFDAVDGLGSTLVRWPGGCTGTSYAWRDGIGPAAERDRVIDAHFGYDVGNGFGTAEFVAYCRRLGAEPVINLTTGLETLSDALAWVEYANFTTPTRWANLRRAHGYEQPFDVRHWQIGNEEWGPWEIGYRTATEYAGTAREWGKAIKKLDPALEVLAVGSWRPHDLVEWNTAVLDEAWDHIDHITAHIYWDFDSAAGQDRYDTIAGAGYLEEQSIKAAGGLIELIARDKESDRRPGLAFTEWNCRDTSFGEMQPDWRPGQTQYRMVDALAVAGFLNAMQRQCAIVSIGAFAQTINVVGALMVSDEHVVRESVYWPLAMLRHHSGTVAIDTHVTCDGYTAPFEGRTVAGIPYLDASATTDRDGGRIVLSLVNRHPTDELMTRVTIPGGLPAGEAVLHRLWHEDRFARNTIDQPDAIAPRTSTIAVPAGGLELVLPPHSFSMLELGG